MNELKLKEMNEERIIYLYQPEGDGEYGEILYKFADDETSVIKQSKDDEYGRYAHKAELKVKEYVKENYLPLKGTQAWY